MSAATPSLTTQEIIDYIKSEGAVPASQKTFQDADFVRLINTEFMTGLVPSILNVHEDYFVYEDTINIVNGVLRYDIPYRAIGGKLRDLFYLQSTDNTSLFPLSRVAIDDIPAFYNGMSTGVSVSHYYIEGSQIVLLTLPNSGQLLVKHFLRPNQLVLDAEVGVITTLAPSGSNTVITMSASPTAFTSADLYDFIQGKPGHRTMDYDVAPVSVANGSNQITFLTANIPTGLAVGDHVCLAGESKIPQCPPELHPILAHRVVQRIMEAQGDEQGYTIASAKVAELEKKTYNLIDNRVEGSPIKITNFFSPMRAIKRWNRGGWTR